MKTDNELKIEKLRKEAWIKRVMDKLHYSREEAEKAFDRIKPDLNMLHHP